MIHIRSIILLVVLALAYPVQAEEPPSDQLPEGMLDGENRTYVSASLENDLFGGGKDQNYTNGFRISWFEPERKPPGITERLEGVLPFLDVNDSTSVTYSLGHNLYTPKDIESREQDPTDRPWAAFLYGSMGMATVADNYLDEYEFILGVVGPLALGEEIQETVHDITGSPEPRGWDNQLKNEPGFMLSWQRRWPELQQDDIMGAHLTLVPHFGLTAGNIYTYANVGTTFKISSKGRDWTDKPMMVRPSIPGTGFFPRARTLYWEAFLALDGRAMVQNIFLDGNTFRDSHSVPKKTLVGDASAGITMTWGRMRVGYTLVYRTKEYVGQGAGEVFGAVNIGYIL